MKLTDIKRLFASNDNRAVSPVIGVILMVAITVILAAVIGTFVLGLGSGVQSTPQASFSFDYTQNTDDDTDTLKITHGGGDKIKSSQLSASLSDAYNNTVGTTNGVASSVDIFNGTEKVGAGDTFTIDNTTVLDNYKNEDLILNESTVRIVFERQDKPETAILAEFEGPDA